jgi:hypothetical protein
MRNRLISSQLTRTIRRSHLRMEVSISLISIVNLADQYRQLTESGKAVSVQWQESESVAFVARGREYRSGFTRTQATKSYV